MKMNCTAFWRTIHPDNIKEMEIKMRSVPILIIGGGAAGMMAAASAIEQGGRVMVIEKMAMLGKKILATGNGRCNFTNLKQQPEFYHVTGSGDVWKLLRRFDEKRTISFFKEAGVYPEEKDGYVYPMSMQAVSLRNCLGRKLDKAEIHFEEEVTDIEQKTSATGKNTGFIVKTTKDKYLAKKIIVTAGGMAAKCHGSDGKCFGILAKLGHTVVTPVPALTWFKLKEKYTKLWAGVRVKGIIKAYDEDKKLLAHDKGELQLVASGISGIPVFQVSRYISRELEMSKRPYIEVDFLPEFSAEELYEELLRRKRCHPKLETSYILEGIINNKLTDAVLLKCGIGSRTLLNELTGRQCQNICAAVKCFRADVSETAGFDNAQVTSGGVSRSEIDFEDMSSKVCDGLYLAGEIVDVDGICGGYNLQWAWSSGYIAGKSAAGGKQK